MFESYLLRLEGDGRTRLCKRGVGAQYVSIRLVAVAYEFLLTTLEKAKVEIADRLEPRYHASCIKSASAKLNKYYSKLDKAPIYYAAAVLHPSVQLAFPMAYGDKEDWLSTAR